MQMTLTIPDRIGNALKAKAAEFEMQAPDFVKSLLFAATQSPQGVVLKLELAPLAKAELPLFDAAGVSLEADINPQP